MAGKLIDVGQLRLTAAAAAKAVGDVAAAAADAIGELSDEVLSRVPVREVTKAQYDALSEADKAAAVMYIITDAPSGGGAAPAGSNVPAGGIIIWSGASDAVPEGWAVCDGKNGTPDLRGRFVLAESTSYAHGATGGAATVTLTAAQLPAHSHGLNLKTRTQNVNSAGGTTYTFAITGANTLTSAPAGATQSHNNMPPYYVLCYIMKL